ncbi:hypothetical protein D3C87_2074900 [compost metagenome]
MAVLYGKTFGRESRSEMKGIGAVKSLKKGGQSCIVGNEEMKKVTRQPKLALSLFIKY